MAAQSQGTSTDGASPDWMRREIERLKMEKEQLENRISDLESQLHSSASTSPVGEIEENSSFCSIADGLISSSNGFSADALSPDMIYRYSRQLLLPDFGVEG
jgi:adenylyltransferase and sulfurtransferase